MESDVDILVSGLLMEQGGYDPIELLLADGRLFYEDYETWRAGAGAPLDRVLFGDPVRTRRMLEQAAALARDLGLEPERQAYPCWGGADPRPLVCSLDNVLDELLRTRYRRCEEQPQLDLFMDSGATALVNDVIAALAGRDLAEAERSIQRLRDTEPGHHRLGQIERLLEAARALGSPVIDVSSELEVLERQLLPLAEDLLGADGRHFLAPLWRRLGKALEGDRFDPADARLHVSYVAECLRDWEAVIASVEREPDWRGEPELLRRHARAWERLREPWRALADWMLLCWRFPDQSDVIAREAGSEWRISWLKFSDIEPEIPAEDFPAWLLIQRPGLAGRLDAETLAIAPDSFRLIRSLLQDAGPGIELRRALRDSAPLLLTQYLATVQAP